MGMLLPSSDDESSPLAKVHLLAMSGELSPRVAILDFECNDLPHIQKDLLKAEFEARKSLCRIISAYVSFQLIADQDSEESQKAYSSLMTSGKILLPLLSSVLATFLSARRA